MADPFTDRREPDYEITVHVTGKRLGRTGKITWRVEVEGTDDKELAADILDKAVLVLRGEHE